MARRPSPADLQKAKEAKQKKLLLLLVPLFLGLVAWQGPKTLKAFSGSSAAPPPTTTTTTPPPVTTPGATTPSGATPPPSGASPVPSVPELNETDPFPEPLEGQLVSFSQFESRDPFGGLGIGEGGSTTTTTTTGTTTTGTTGGRAVIEVNGDSEDVGVEDEFPAGSPAFRLVSVDGQTARIGLVSGTFSTGTETIEVRVGETFILVSETDGMRYVIRLVSLAAS